MEVIFARCAGIDIGKRNAKVCVRIAGENRSRTQETVTTWGSMSNDILALREHLLQQRVECVVMEATGDYWKPFYYALEDAGFVLMLVNARHVKNMPGRKSDVSDATWLAQLAAHGLVRASFVPPPVVRALRDLTRTRVTIVRERAREQTRLEKLLEDAGIKLSSVVSSLTGVSATAMLRAMIAGERDPRVLAALADRRLHATAETLTEALTGQFTEHHAFLAQIHLDQIERHDAAIAALTERIEVVMEPFRAFRDLICTIPGISTRVADIVIAETGADMSVFETADRLASWAGVVPGSNESAGVIKSTRTRPGNVHLKGALGIAAMAATRTQGSFYKAKYDRLRSRRGPSRALVAIQRSMLIAIWHMAHTGAIYVDPGGDYYTKRQPEHARNKAIKTLHSLGYRVTLEHPKTA